MKRFLIPKEGGADSKRKKENDDDDETCLRVVQWNVDGLDDNLVEERAGEVCSILLEDEDATPDVILLQEVVTETTDIFHARLMSSGYEMQPSTKPTNAPYFTLAFFKSSRIKAKEARRTAFPGTSMGRDLIRVEAEIEGVKSSTRFLFMTSHLESLGDPPNAAERCRQLSQVLQQLTDFSGPALFAGDTNLREKEVAKEPKYKAIVDAWIACGSEPNAKATWDLLKNTNKQMPGSFQPRMRLDRMLLNKTMAAKGLKDWTLLGTEKMAEGCFPSDHFGISCRIKIPS